MAGFQLSINGRFWVSTEARASTVPKPMREAWAGVARIVVESDHAQLSELVQRLRHGRLRTNIGNVAALDDAVAAFNRTERIRGKTVIRVRP